MNKRRSLKETLDAAVEISQPVNYYKDWGDFKNRAIDVGQRGQHGLELVEVLLAAILYDKYEKVDNAND